MGKKILGVKNYLNGYLNFKEMPKRGESYVYCIHIGNKYYIGSTGDCKRRFQVHVRQMNLMANGHDIYNSIYDGMKATDIVKYGFFFSLIKKFRYPYAGNKYERELIWKNTDTGLLLNAKYKIAKKKRSNKFLTYPLGTENILAIISPNN